MYDMKNLNSRQFDYFKSKFNLSHVGLIGNMLIAFYRNHVLGVVLDDYCGNYSGSIEDYGSLVDVVRTDTISDCIKSLISMVDSRMKKLD